MTFSMKKTLLALGGAIVMLASCKEKAPPINLTDLTSVDFDTLVVPVPAAEEHNVLVDEFTGQTCANCPAAHEALKSIKAGYAAGRINVLGLYYEGPSQSKPPYSHGGINDFRTEAAKQINSQAYGSKWDLPGGGVDRELVAGQIFLYRGSWASAIATQIAKPTPVNLNVTSVFDESKQEATITVTAIYTQAVTAPHNLSVAIVEDSIIDVQENNTVTGGFEEHYVFMNVLRDMITNIPYGNELKVWGTRDAKEPGRSMQRIFKYKVLPRTKTTETPINPKHCHVVAYINNVGSGNYAIVQSKSAELAP